MPASAISNLLDARFTTAAYYQRTNSSVPDNPLLQAVNAVKEDVFGSTIEVKVFPATNVPAPTNNYGSKAKPLPQIGAKKVYHTPIHAFNEIPLDIMSCMFLEMDDRPELQAMGKSEVERQMQNFRTRHNLLRTVVAAKTLFGGVIYRDVDGNITETSSSGPTIDLGFNATTNGGSLDRANYNNFQSGSGNIIDALWSNPSTDIMTQLDDIKELQEHRGNEAPADIWCHTSIKRYLRNNTSIKDWVKYNLGGRVETILKGDVWNDINGFNWHFFGGTYQNDSGSTQTMFPRNKVAIIPPIEKGGWFRAIDACFPVPGQSGVLQTGVDPTSAFSSGRQIVYGDFMYAKETDNPSIYIVRGGTTFLYAFTNPDAIIVPTIA